MPDSEGVPTITKLVDETTGVATEDGGGPASAPAAEPQTLWSAIRESLRGGGHHDYTSGPIGRSIIMLAIPMVLEMCMESIFAVVDIKWVS